jgi:hypothetical protein
MGLFGNENYVYPVLYGEMGLVNFAVDVFNDLYDNIEKLLEEEKIARNNMIMADVACDEAIGCLKTFKESESIGFCELMKKQAATALKQCGLSLVEKNRLHQDIERNAVK